MGNDFARKFSRILAVQIVVANRDNTVSVFLNNGNVTFVAKTDYAVGDQSYSVTIGDCNTDGKPDLVTGAADTLSILTYITELEQVSGTILFEGIASTAASQTVNFVFRAEGEIDFSLTCSVPRTGAVTLTVPKRNGTLTIKSFRCLTLSVALDTIGGGVSGVTAGLRADDANNDNTADIRDLLVLIYVYNKVSPAGGYSSAADFNLDGANDIGNLFLLIGNDNQLGH